MPFHFRFIYYERAVVNGDNVLALLYAAKKYWIPALETKCRDFLNDQLCPTNVCPVLDQVSRDRHNVTTLWTVHVHIKMKTPQHWPNPYFVPQSYIADQTQSSWDNPWRSTYPVNYMTKNATWRWQWTHLVIRTHDKHYLRYYKLLDESWMGSSQMNFFLVHDFLPSEFWSSPRRADRQTDRRTESDS